MPIIDVNARFGAYPTRHRSATYEHLSSEAQALGIDASVICSNTGIYFDHAEGNQETLVAAKAQPNRLIPAATLNPAAMIDPEAAIDEIASGGFRIVRFFPDEQEWPIDFAPFEHCLRRLVERGLPVMISCSRLGDATKVARLVKAADGSVPVVLEGVTGDNLAEAIAALRDSESLLLETHALLFADALAAVRDVVGIRRIVFGSGAAAQSLGASLSYVNGSSLSAEDKAQVLGGVATRLLRLSA